MIYKRCSRCGKRIKEGTACNCIKSRHKEYDKYFRDKRSDTFYHSKPWMICKEYVLGLDDHTDVYIYMTTGKIVIADTVHHVEQLKDNWDKRLNPDNLMSLNHDTHSKIEQMYKKDKDKAIALCKDLLQRYRNGMNV